MFSLPLQLVQMGKAGGGSSAPTSLGSAGLHPPQHISHYKHNAILFLAFLNLFQTSELEGSCIRWKCLSLCFALSIWDLHGFIPVISLFNHFCQK